MSQVFEGCTVDAEAPFLAASFWSEGVSVSGTVSKIFEVELERDGQTKKSTCYSLDLENPVAVDGEEQDRVSVGNMAGIQMALSVMKRVSDGKIGNLVPRLNDVMEITCAGVKPAKKDGYSDRVNFRIKLTRP